MSPLHLRPQPPSLPSRQEQMIFPSCKETVWSFRVTLQAFNNVLAVMQLKLQLFTNTTIATLSCEKTVAL